MKATYPFIPRSTAQLEPGQFWTFTMRNSEYACGVVLQLVSFGDKTNTRMFVAGLLNWTGSQKPTSDDLVKCAVIEHGEVHIKTITENSGEILGKIPWDESRLEIPLSLSESPGPNCMLQRGSEILGKASPEQQENLDVFGTWGYRFICRLAEKHFANVA